MIDATRSAAPRASSIVTTRIGAALTAAEHPCALASPLIYAAPVVAASSYAVAPSYAAAPAPRCTCLTKNTPDGLVVFQDVCTKEAASAPVVTRRRNSGSGAAVEALIRSSQPQHETPAPAGVSLFCASRIGGKAAAIQRYACRVEISASASGGYIHRMVQRNPRMPKLNPGPWTVAARLNY